MTDVGRKYRAARIAKLKATLAELEGRELKEVDINAREYLHSEHWGFGFRDYDEHMAGCMQLSTAFEWRIIEAPLSSREDSSLVPYLVAVSKR